jgi:Holliday junction resolvase
MPSRLAESDVQRAIFRYLISQNFLVVRINSGAVTQTYRGKERHFSFVRWQESGRRPSSRGLADILALAPWGQLFVIECKAPGNIGRTSDQQAAFLEAAERRRAVAIIADQLEDVITAIRYHRGMQKSFERIDPSDGVHPF